MSEFSKLIQPGTPPYLIERDRRVWNAALDAAKAKMPHTNDKDDAMDMLSALKEPTDA